MRSELLKQLKRYGSNLFDLIIAKRILSIHHTMQLGKKNEFNRYLPFNEYIVDRWERAEQLGFGSRSSIYDSSVVLGNVIVGENTWIGPFTILDGSGSYLRIGNNCAISAGAQIYTHDTVKRNISGGKEDIEYAPTIIEDNCYIGPNVIISKGLTIGKGSIIGANSFVNLDVPSKHKAFGSPAKIYKQ